MSDTPPTAPPPPPPSGPKPPWIFTPRAEPHCRHCAFALLGLPASGTCPECGTAYDPSNSYTLCNAPTALQSVAYLGRPLLYSVLASIAGIIFFPPVSAVAIPVAIAWTGWNIHVYRETMRTRVLPLGMAVAPGVRPLGIAASIAAKLLVGAGALLTVGAIVFVAACFLR
jgi:hypothetical protein